MVALSLHAVLDTNNGLVKTQVFQLLSAMCVYSEGGYKLAMDALEDYKVPEGGGVSIEIPCISPLNIQRLCMIVTISKTVWHVTVYNNMCRNVFIIVLSVSWCTNVQ